MKISRVLYIILFFCVVCLNISAQQIRGYITDAETGDSIPFASVVYKGHHIAVVSDIQGLYTINRHEGWNITFSA
ncbi:MAG: carboxypeptidase-like regulatory domain-containing protein, partial [Prevotella sp.]|nr:carboxypeptidase-like regulatory domain-containing protein [Prevotella sp.]